MNGSQMDFLDVELPDSWDEWDENAQLNFLLGAMNRTQIANELRSAVGLETRDKPMFKKAEIAQILAEVTEENDA